MRFDVEDVIPVLGKAELPWPAKCPKLNIEDEDSTSVTPPPPTDVTAVVTGSPTTLPAVPPNHIIIIDLLITIDKAPCKSDCVALESLFLEEHQNNYRVHQRCTKKGPCLSQYLKGPYSLCLNIALKLPSDNQKK